MNQEILEIKRNLIDNMIEYMKYGGAVDENDPEYDPGFDAGYTQEHVDRCSEIIDDFLALLENTPEAQKNKYIIAAVKKTVLRLNDLNKECDGDLILTLERDYLGGSLIVINLSAHKPSNLVSLQ
ncbi:MAG: hypothetical protein L0220_34670 [Acidobacteria bacterium]|nr:hypothetical protein [Acidobacteriota bacterium]